MNTRIIEKMMGKAYKKIPTCEQIVVATADGIGIACYPPNCDFADSIAASSTSITGLSDASSEFLGKGEVNYTLIRSNGGYILVFGMGTFNLFIMAGKKVNLGLLLLVGNRLSDDLAQSVSEIVVERELEEDVHMLARELAEAQSEDKVQIELMLEDEEGDAVPKDLKEKIELAGQIADECAKKDIPCDIRISIEEPVKRPAYLDHTDLEPTTEKIEPKVKINPEDVKPSEIKYHNEVPIYHQEPHKDKPEPTQSPVREHEDEMILEPTTFMKNGVKFIPDDVKRTEVRHMNDSEIKDETVEFKERAMQDYGVTHDDHVLEPTTEKLPEVEKPVPAKPVEVRRMNDSEISHERTEFEPKPMQDYGKDHEDHILEPTTEHIPAKDAVNPEEVKPQEVKWHNEVPIYHEEPKKDSPDPTIIPKTEHVDETVLEPTTLTKRYDGTRILPEEVKPVEVRRMNDSIEHHEPVEFQQKEMKEYGKTYEDHTLEPTTEKIEVEQPNPDDVKPSPIIRAGEEDHAKAIEFTSDRAKIDESAKQAEIDPNVSSVLDRLNKAIDSFKNSEKNSLFDKDEADPFADKDDLTEY